MLGFGHVRTCTYAGGLRGVVRALVCTGFTGRLSSASISFGRSHVQPGKEREAASPPE